MTKRFHEGRPNEVVAVRDVSLGVERGSVSVLEGPSGSGTTTLLTLIGGVARPSEGRVRLDGERLSSLPEHHLAAARRRHFGIVFQRFNLVPGMSAAHNVILLPARLQRLRSISMGGFVVFALLGALLVAHSGLRAGG